MAAVYRGTAEEKATGRPVSSVPPGATSLALMARVSLHGEPSKVRADLPADVDGFVHPATGGMSVNSDPAGIPHFCVPLRLQGVPPFRNGTAGGDTHGMVEPARPAHHAAYNSAIAATCLGWRIDEPPVPSRAEVTT